MSVTSRGERGAAQRYAPPARRQYQLLNDWLFGGYRQIADDQVNFVADLLRGDVGIFFEEEGDEDLRYTFNRGGAQLVNAADGVDCALNLVGDLGLDFLRRRAGIDYGYGDGRQINLETDRSPATDSQRFQRSPTQDDRSRYRTPNKFQHFFID